VIHSLISLTSLAFLLRRRIGFELRRVDRAFRMARYSQFRDFSSTPHPHTRRPQILDNLRILYSTCARQHPCLRKENGRKRNTIPRVLPFHLSYAKLFPSFSALSFACRAKPPLRARSAFCSGVMLLEAALPPFFPSSEAA